MATPLEKVSAASAQPAPAQAFVPFADIDEICKAVQGFAAWEADWDGYGAVLPAKSDIDNAIDFIRQIPFAIQTPKATIDGGGDVGFEWEKGNVYVEVAFNHGDIFFIVRTGAGDERIGGDEKYRGFIPEALQQAMARTIKIGA